MQQITEVLEQMKHKHDHSNNNMEMCFDENTEIVLPRDFPVQPIHPDKPIKEGVCPICRGDNIVKVIKNGVERYSACVCCEEKEALQKCIDIVERIRKKQKENKEQEKVKSCSGEDKIEFMPMHPDRPIKEGECPICGGKGLAKVFINGVFRDIGICSCVRKKDNMEFSMRKLRETGIAESIEKYTFDSFQTPEEWQKTLKQLAIQFLDEKEKWFFIGGQVGCGKTHICTAIVGEFFKTGKSVRYVLWANEVIKLKANKMDDINYQKLINPLLKAEMLYIDDFFKTEKGKHPSEADIRTAFEIINYRYVNKELITIISCEKTIDDLLDIDEAIGSRIYQKSKEYASVVTQDKNKNWRLRA